MIEQLLIHGVGDFILQTDKQALNKKNKGWFGFRQCLYHCTTYSLPFLIIGSWQAVSVIFLTHFIIDRTRIVDYVLAWKNNVRYNESQTLRKGQPDEFTIYGMWHGKLNISNFGFGLERPFAISIWLYIITDNLCHLIINYFALKYL